MASQTDKGSPLWKWMERISAVFGTIGGVGALLEFGAKNGWWLREAGRVVHWLKMPTVMFVLLAVFIISGMCAISLAKKTRHLPWPLKFISVIAVIMIGVILDFTGIFIYSLLNDMHWALSISAFGIFFFILYISAVLQPKFLDEMV